MVLADEEHDDLAGITLLTHMNRKNPLWASLRDGVRVLVIFQGPRGYVSPTVYGVSPAAPTWNFTVVHAHGVVRLIEAGEPTLRVVKHTVQVLERRFGAGWDMTGSIGYFERIVPAVGALEIHVDAVESMFKLSQDQPAELQAKVAAAFAGSGRGTHRELAEQMYTHLDLKVDVDGS
ncbi:transcriptional regulator [Actinoplanes couchii]|nr:transcriptional regulator [Actinoplanes couchii]